MRASAVQYRHLVSTERGAAFKEERFRPRRLQFAEGTWRLADDNVHQRKSDVEQNGESIETIIQRRREVRNNIHITNPAEITTLAFPAKLFVMIPNDRLYKAADRI